MKPLQIVLILAFAFFSHGIYAQEAQKTYEITITATDAEGNSKVKKMVIEDQDLSQEEIDKIVQEHLDGHETDVDVNINVNVNESSYGDGEAKTITKIIKQRNNLSEEEKIIVEEAGMEIEVKGDKVYINGEEVQEGDFGDKKVRILKFEEGEDIDLENILEGGDIEIGEGEKIIFIEREETSEGLGFLGVTTTRNNDDGVRIIRVVENSAAEKIGLKVDDIILSIGGKKTNDTRSLSKAIKSFLPAESTTVVYISEGQTIEKEVSLSDYDEFITKPRNEWQRKRRGHHKRHHNFKTHDSTKPRLGVVIEDQNEGDVLILEIQPGSAAAKAGLKPGDIVSKIDKTEILSVDQLIATVQAHKIGDEVKVKVLRDGKKKTIRATLEKQPRRDGLKDNTSSTIERIIIKERLEEDLNDFETSGAIKVRDFDLSPNPSDGEVKVRFEMDALKSNEAISVRIISLDGKIIEENTVDAFDGFYNKTFDLSDSPSGVYLFQVEKNKQKFTKRFVIKQN